MRLRRKGSHSTWTDGMDGNRYPKRPELVALDRKLAGGLPISLRHRGWQDHLVRQVDAGANPRGTSRGGGAACGVLRGHVCEAAALACAGLASASGLVKISCQSQIVWPILASCNRFQAMPANALDMKTRLSAGRQSVPAISIKGFLGGVRPTGLRAFR